VAGVEGIEVVPATPVTDHHRVHVGAAQLRGPRAPEVVEVDLLPAGVVGFVLELVGGAVHPAPEGALRDVEQLLHFLLGESYILAVVVGIVFEVHRVR
jgi:hypothetical protein